MALSKVQNSSPCNTELQKKSFIGATTVGAISGYALKWMIPVLPQEHDDVFIPEAKQIEADAKVLSESIAELMKGLPDLKGAEEVVNLYDSKGKTLPAEAEEVSKFSQDGKKIYAGIRERININKNIEFDKRLAYTKGLRSTIAFSFIGATVGLAYAVYHNVKAEKAKSKA